MNCPNCGKKSTNGRYCRNCGFEMAQLEAKTKTFNTAPIDDSKNPSILQNETETKNSASEGELDPRFILRKLIYFILKLALILTATTIVLHILVATLTRDSSGPQQLIEKVKSDSDPTYLIMAILSALVVIFLITPIGFPRKISDLSSQVIQGSFHQFLNGWSAIWITWFLLYLYISIIFLIVGQGILVQNFVVQVIVDFLNVCTSTAFLFLFLVLDLPSISTPIDQTRNKEFKQNFSFVIVISFLIFLFSVLGRYYHGNFEIGVHISGIFAAIAMAYVFGRLDSHYMNVPRWMLAPLYLYAVIQVAGPILVDFGETPLDSSVAIKGAFQKVFFVSALLLKIYLFVVVNYWLHFGAFEKYFNFARDYIEESDSNNN